jgi:hypothetical protein
MARTGNTTREAGITKRPPIQVGIDVAAPIARRTGSREERPDG